LLAGERCQPPDGSPILLISRLAVHTRNVLADARVSLMLDERAAGDPLEGARIMLAGRAEMAGNDDVRICGGGTSTRIPRPRPLPISRISPFTGSGRAAPI
jgi:hypothetical protein